MRDCAVKVDEIQINITSIIASLSIFVNDARFL